MKNTKEDTVQPNLKEEIIEWTEWLGRKGWYMKKGENFWQHDDEDMKFFNTKGLVQKYYPIAQTKTEDSEQDNCEHDFVYKILYDHTAANICTKCKLIVRQDKADNEQDLQALSDYIISNHNLPLLKIDEPKFQSINGALNYFIAGSMNYTERRGMTIDEVKSLFLKCLVYYRHSSKVKEVFKDFGINDFERDSEQSKPVEGVIPVTERLYYEANPNTRMDVPSYAYEQVEKANKRRFEAKSALNLYDWCINELSQPSAPVESVENDAINFANWLLKNAYMNGTFGYYSMMEDKEGYYVEVGDLYKEFLKSKLK